MGQRQSKKEDVPDVTYIPVEGPKYTIVNPGASIPDMILETNNKQYKFVELPNGRYQLSECK